MTVALNTFKTQTAVLTTSSVNIYTTPVGYTGIVLMAQIANISNSSGQITFVYSDGITDTELLKNFTVPGNDSVAVTKGKLVVESGYTIKAYASRNSDFKLMLSILETVNG